MILYDLTVKEIFKKLKEGYAITDIEKRLAFPCMFPELVPIDKVILNSYNPNSVAPPEMGLLQHSIEQDGYTQPVVCIYDKEKDRYVVIDGEHRYRNAKEKFKLPLVPVVAINKEMKDRMASTIRHNRARGVHKIRQMSVIVAEMLMLGWSEEQVAKHLGMDADEILRLKQNSGIAELFKNHEYSNSWEIDKNE